MEILGIILPAIIAFLFWEFFSGNSEMKNLIRQVGYELNAIEYGQKGQIGVDVKPLFNKGTQAVANRIADLHALQKAISGFSIKKLWYIYCLAGCKLFHVDFFRIGKYTHELSHSGLYTGQDYSSY